jgi:hypothetical protein
MYGMICSTAGDTPWTAQQKQLQVSDDPANNKYRIHGCYHVETPHSAALEGVHNKI